MKSLDELNQENSVLAAERSSLRIKLTEAENIATQALEAQQKAEQERDAAVNAKTQAIEGKAAAEKSLGEANAKITKLEGEAKTADQRAMEIAASFGVKPGSKEISKSNAGGGENSTMSRADFNNLSTRAQAEFCKGGGKLTD